MLLNRAVSRALSHQPSCALCSWRSNARAALTAQITEWVTKQVVPPRHSVLVRITHWITTLSFLALLVSGIAILLAHPRLYWGETGAVGAPSLIDLPLPFMLTGQSGWGRSLHFFAAWLCCWW